MTDIASPIEEALTNTTEVWEALDHSAIAEAIPIAGHVVRVLRAANRISDSLLAAKLLSFIREPSLQTPEARQRMRERAESEEGRKVGETLFLVLERLNDMQKPVWIAKCYAGYLAGEMRASDFRRVTSAIDIAFGDDLVALITSPEPPPDNEAAWMANLVTSGLTSFYVLAPLGGTKTIYHVSELGKMLRKAVRDH